MEKNKLATKEFHAVEFMREARHKMTEEYYKDKEKYLAKLRKAMEDFKRRQKKAFS